MFELGKAVNGHPLILLFITVKYIEDVAQWLEDMNFMVEWQELSIYLTSERCERVRFCSCHGDIKFISSSKRVMFFLLHRHTHDGVFDDFPTISDHFPKISEASSKLVQRSHKRCRTFSENFQKFPMISEEC